MVLGVKREESTNEIDPDEVTSAGGEETEGLLWVIERVKVSEEAFLEEAGACDDGENASSACTCSIQEVR